MYVLAIILLYWKNIPIMPDFSNFIRKSVEMTYDNCYLYRKYVIVPIWIHIMLFMKCVWCSLYREQDLPI